MDQCEKCSKNINIPKGTYTFFGKCKCGLTYHYGCATGVHKKCKCGKNLHLAPHNFQL